MPQRKKARDKSTEAAASKPGNMNLEQRQEADVGTGPDSTSDPTSAQVPRTSAPVPKMSRGSLKEFVENFKDRHYYVIEMRIVLIVCIAVFFKLFFSDVILREDEDALTLSAFSFVGLCVVVIIFSTWLDYFPSRLVDVVPRECKGQGLPMACLFLPMVCSAQLYFSLHHAKHMAGLLEVYLVVLCLLSLCTILATLLHSIPHPNHITFYNFAVLGGAYAVQMTLGVTMWMTLPAITIYSLLGAWLIDAFPRSFTLGEAMIVTQTLTLVAVDVTLQLLTLYEVVPVSESLVFSRNESVLYVELLIVGVAVCCMLLSPALYKLAQSRHYHEKKFWSGTFILLSLSIGFMLILPWLGRLLGGHNPIVFVIFTCFSYQARMLLIAFWLAVCLVTGVVVWAQSSPSLWAVRLKPTTHPWCLRKVFHLSALLVFLTGIALDPSFTALAASLVTFLFAVTELVHLCRMWPCGETLHQLLLPFFNNSDSAGPLVVSHLYLLLGFSLPVWLCPIRGYNQVAKLSMYSGVLSLGIGDAVASIVGRLYGKLKWPGTKKTVEGSLASLLAQLVGVFVITLVDHHLPTLSGRDWGIVSISLLIPTALEAYTWQIDNLILGVFQYAILVTFLN